MRGKLLYADFVNNKPPLLYVYYSLAQLLFGRNMFAVHLLTVLLTVPLTALALASFYRYTRTGMIAGLLFLVYSASFYAHDMLSANTELLMILPAAWGVTRFQSDPDFLSTHKVAECGLLIGIALLFKYPVILWLFPVAIALLYSGFKNKKSFHAQMLVIVFLVSFVIPPALTCAYFAWRGGEQELIYWLFGNNLRYTANPIAFREAIGRAFSYFLPFLITTAPLWYFSFQKSGTQQNAVRVLLLGLILFTLPAAFWGFRFYPHYFIPFYVPLALCSAPAVGELLSRRRKSFLIYTAVIFVGFTIANSILYLGDSKVYQEKNPAFRNVAQRLKNDSCYDGATLFVWGYAPIVYYYAELPAASRFVVLPQSGLTSYISGRRISSEEQINQRHWDWLFSDLEKNRVTFILDFAPSGIFRWNLYPIHQYPRLQQYLNTHFNSVDSVDDVVIYRRKHCS
jgi:hypothetical protein